MKFHRGCVGKKVGSIVGQETCEEIGISCVFARASELRGNDDKKAALELGDESSVPGLMKETAGEWNGEVADLRGLRGCKRSASAVVESHKKVRHTAAAGLQIGVMVCAH